MNVYSILSQQCNVFMLTCCSIGAILIVDSEASSHIIPCCSWFQIYWLLQPSCLVILEDSSNTIVIGIGTVPLIFKASGDNILLTPWVLNFLDLSQPDCLSWSLHCVPSLFWDVLCWEGLEHHTCCHLQEWTVLCMSCSRQPKESCTCHCKHKFPT